ncbi:MAG: ComF family protein [Peptococcaceae bacterium]|nr:MAG: ComF family protein [Peptococcaceae bacterium]
MVWDAFLDLFFPPRLVCPLCEKPGTRAAVCEQCGELLAGYRRQRVCCRCGRFFNHSGGSCPDPAVTCPDCLAGESPFFAARAVGPYEGRLRTAVHRLKYGGRKFLARALAMLMVAVISPEEVYRQADLVVPVPLARARLQQRGFNQSELLARWIGRFMGLPVDGKALVKVKDTPPQAGLCKKDREINLRDAFKVNLPDMVSGKKILLVDDVFTTGSTVSVAAASLIGSGARLVVVATVSTAYIR